MIQHHMRSKSHSTLTHMTILLLTISSIAANAATIQAIAAALDLPDGITLMAQKYVVFQLNEDDESDDPNVDFLYDEITGLPVPKSTSNDSKWVVQTKEEYHTAPLEGGSCLRSNLGTNVKGTSLKSYDARAARLVFKVTGPGSLNFSFKTSTDSEYIPDSLNVYVDGELQTLTDITEGYGNDEEYGWGYADASSTENRRRATIEIPAGIVENNTYFNYVPIAGTYDHEIVFEFLKGPARYVENWTSGKYQYAPDGPVQPIQADYDMDGNGKLDAEEKVDYEADMQIHKEQLALFHNCIWLDHFVWEPTKPSLNFYETETSTPAWDFLKISFNTNVADFGYAILYTTDGSKPNATSTLYNETAGITIDKDNTTVTANVFAKLEDGTYQLISEDLEISHTFSIIASSPVVKRNDTLSSPTEIVLDVTQSYEPNSIHYTTDGTTPTANSPKLEQTTIRFSAPCTFKAICARDGIQNSVVVSYEIQQTPQPLPVQLVDNAGNTILSNVYFSTNIYVKCTTTANATCRYSIDGADYVAYTKPFLLKASNNKTSATAVIVAEEEDKLASIPYSITVYPAVASWTLSTSNGTNVTQMQVGWNLVAFPITLAPEYLAPLQESYVFYSYDANAETYTQMETLAEGTAYFMFLPCAQANMNLEIWGAAITTANPLPSTQGWHAYGATQDTSLPEDTTAWTYQNGKFVNVQELKKGKGYFIYNP